MRLLDFLVAEATVDDLEAVEKEDVIREMVGALTKAGAVSPRNAKAVTRAIMDRENLGSTGIGRGIAIPHTKHPSAKKIVGCLGRSKKGISFSAIDGEPVYVVFLLLSPPDEPGPHLKALEHISIVLRDENFSRFLKRAKDRDELIGLVAEADEKLLKG